MTANYQHSTADLATLLAPLGSGWPQAAATGYDANNADLNTLFAEAASGTAAGIVGYQQSGTDIGSRFAAIGTTSIAVGTQPTAVSGSAASTTVTSNTTTVAGAKGKLSYTYSWSLTHGAGAVATLTAASSATTAVTSTAVVAGTPATGTIQCNISDGTTNINTNSVAYSLTNTTFTPVTNTYTGALGSTSGTETVPTGATHLTITIWGGGGTSDGGSSSHGGGSGAYCQKTVTVTGGQTFTYVAGAWGDPNGNLNGTASTVTGSAPVVNMSAGGGFQQGSSTPTASGGDTNTSGNLPVSGNGASAPNGGTGGTFPSGVGNAPGGGGAAGTGNGGHGGGGRAQFAYT